MQHQTAIPFIGAIIERISEGGDLEILIQTRWKPERDPKYSGTFEFVAGVLDKQYENVYETLRREVLEETGLQLDKVINDSQTKVFSPQKDDGAFGFRPFCCTQQLKDGKPWVGFIFRCRVKDGEPKDQEAETRGVHWMKATELRDIFNNNPEKLFTLEIPAWDYYFNEVEIG